MKIHFCDLCNESVPQSELDAGRAFMRKGRVVCVKCDQLMTQHEASGAASAPFSGGAYQSTTTTTTEQQASLTPVAAPTGAGDFGAGAFPAGGTHPHHHAHPVHVRPQGSGSGVAVALFSIALTVLGLWWLTERSDRNGVDFEKKIAEVKAEQLAAEMRGMQHLTELDGRMAKLEDSVKDSVESQRKGLESRLLDAQSKQEKALAPLGDLKADVAGLKGIVPSTQRHDQELIASAQKIADLESRAHQLETAMAEMKKQLEAKPAAAPGSLAGGPGAPAAPVGTPAWMGLVQQLESANSGDRWVAVSSLGETRDPAVAEYLLPRLKDVDIFVRMATARVLGDLGSSKATSALIEALNDQDSSVREAAYVSLCTVSKKSLPFDAHQEPAERAKRVKAWQEWWKKAQEDGAAQ